GPEISKNLNPQGRFTVIGAPLVERKIGVLVVVLPRPRNDQIGIVCFRPGYIADAPPPKIERDNLTEGELVGTAIEKPLEPFQLKENSVRADLRIAQADEQVLAPDHQAFDVEAVFLWRKIGIFGVFADGLDQRSKFGSVTGDNQ